MSDIGLSEPSSRSSDMSETVRLALLERRVGDLDESHRKWYRNPSVVISFIALLTSIMSFAYGWYKDINKERDKKRTELQSSIVLLNNLTNQSVEAYEKYKNAPDYQRFIYPAIEAEIALVGTKAYGLLNSLGDKGAALDSATVANALEQTSDYGAASKALLSGLPNAKNPLEYIIVSRMLGQLEYHLNNSSDVDKYFNQAEQGFKIFPDAHASTQEEESYNMATESYWTVAAASQKLCNVAKSHISMVK